MATQVFERYEVQAYLEVSRGHPKWSRVALTAINGWWFYRDHEHRARDGYAGVHTYSDSLAFAFPEHAKAAMDFFATFTQHYDLRVVKTVHVITEDVVVGPQAPAVRQGIPDTSRGSMWPAPATWTFPRRTGAL